jgi:hypothetical protein
MSEWYWYMRALERHELLHKMYGIKKDMVSRIHSIPNKESDKTTAKLPKSVVCRMDFSDIENRCLNMIDDFREFRGGVEPTIKKSLAKSTGPGTICTGSTVKEQENCTYFELNKLGSNCYWRTIGCDMCGNMRAQLNSRKEK